MPAEPTGPARRTGGAPGALFLLGLAALAVSVAVSVRIGSSAVTYSDLARALGLRLGLAAEPLPPLLDSLIWDLRLPRVLLAALVGAALAVCGAALQAVTRNALADPYLLGVSSGASAGAVTVVVLGAGAVGLAAVWLHATALDGFSFGADTATSLGVDVRVTRLVLLIATALLTSVAVASVGAVGFVGLIVPHGVRFLVGPLHRTLLPFTALAGGIFLVWADALARIAFAPREVPVGVFTALAGVPLFLLVLRRRGEL
ncbi:FecCD family ABC transporter permease [Planomonospora venezuelensis]|uniref:ABC-type Fe3+-siderophore transport system permease subunit n=1 Tax=Planomonospora venezuelensis TaxID=1999 RepID=A0A841DBM3_PLAVE|nr:iron chelate uptake ABC transporter family permease subunit [Planomonospora venezuelensis]MBB5965854.1 ABC-type Fe3+-siderophore transport system permease subunit [Planomonospora venezuelensis]GIN04048.1 hypothetical protein Pve01_57060 [Planomonospora venezuelensis]